MKLLLTSGGLENQSIVDSLRNLIGKEFAETNVAFVPTAGNVEAGDKWWMIKDLTKLKELNFKEVDIVDISAVPEVVWKVRLENADVFVFGGGNTYHLMHWMIKSGLVNLLPKFLKTRVYVGISAGSIIATPKLINAIDERQLVIDLGEDAYDGGLKLVDFMVDPHVNNPHFIERTFKYVEEQSKNWPHIVYALDDNSAVEVNGGEVRVVSEGVWKKLN